MINLKIPYTYSIIFHPLTSTIGEVKKFKKDLKSKAGDYASQNSLAHITIAGFEATENQLVIVMQYLKKFVKNQITFSALFNRLSCSTFSKCAVFLPSSECNDIIHNITKNVRNIITVTEMSKISQPHVSIGRNLSEKQLTIARQLFTDKSFKFDFCQLALRKFHPNTDQYEIIQEFSFTGKPNKENFEQTSIDWDF